MDIGFEIKGADVYCIYVQNTLPSYPHLLMGAYISLVVHVLVTGSPAKNPLKFIAREKYFRVPFHQAAGNQ